MTVEQEGRVVADDLRTSPVRASAAGGSGRCDSVAAHGAIAHAAKCLRMAANPLM